MDNQYTFVDSVVKRIDPKARESLTPEQLLSIREAIHSCRPLEHHPVTVRGTLPLFFVRYYFVFFMGQDRRTSIQKVEIKRRHHGIFAGGLLMLLVGFSPVILLVLFLFYLLKSSLGIDIFPDKHLWDFLGL